MLFNQEFTRTGASTMLFQLGLDLERSGRMITVFPIIPKPGRIKGD